ncbi:MAG: hypothetical protein DWQ18_08205 [Crenarchaeota archaeon]|nr:MAG: hypothetical protein DWQ17_01580 [Thermoproteota archaeon]RDJ33137.1 MAG: hypothetical protein DWQ18_08205 [Thermoproteota archaeon]RDJ36360.1 MAG: hypothetical protein DWQ19_07115 [Thermoproteota archaeon]RDJ38989.1 MAG: hypothetical protein DWQ13_01580 [Thermoproteota archaeon]
MVDTILDDVNELINLEKGDFKILERIKRAAERNEVISVYERDYVRKLVETHLRPKFEELKKESIRKPIESPKQTSSLEKPIPKPVIKKQPIFVSKSNPKTTKIAFGIGAAALAIILIVGVSQFEFDDTGTQEIPTPKVTQKVSGLIIDTDSSSYEIEDIISISGSTDASASKVSLSIRNTQGNLVWSEDVTTKSDGTYSTLLIAGGPGWEDSGKYTISADDGKSEEEVSITIKK